MDDRALANKLAALAGAVAAAVRPADDDLGPSDAAALLAVAGRGPLTVGEVARAAGLSQSAAVRLVDRMERAFLMQRQRRISREVVVEATARGRRRAASLAAARLAGAASFLQALDGADRAALDGLLARLVARPPFDRERDCRLCDREACDCGRGEAG